ncbi:hypothetical protein QUA41_30610 [Microcoleus sp. Pol11C1]|uniref:hypothetical protein n=1 Tax=unclassified Microcoleus TaxID=2642155 RepID=UPI002FD6FE2E
MSLCKGIGNGIGGAIGKWGAGLGSALGLGAAVDLGVRAYTGYGLLETLNVPYIECADGSFATAMEWYGSGLKCPKKKESILDPLISPPQNSYKIGDDYSQLIEAMGGVVFPYVAYHFVSANNQRGYDTRGGWRQGEHVRQTDTLGNTVKEPSYLEGRGDSQVYSPYGDGEGFGGWSSTLYSAGINYQSGIRNDTIIRGLWEAYKRNNAALVGIRVNLPNLPLAPPAISIPPPPAFSPNPAQPPEECDMSCPCITPADVEKAVKKALGLNPFSPEKLIREVGAKMYAAPGPSLVPVVPTSLVDAIAAIVATVYMRAGYARYPVVMPGSLINDNSVTDAVPALPIENFAEWFEWHIKQQDAIQGEFPIEIAIVDGAKRQPLKFENISEALAELAGLTIQTATDADAAVSVASHAAVAATKAQTAAIIAQKNVECVIKFFGIRTGYGSILVDSVITPMDSDSPNFNLKKFLTPSKQSVMFYTDNDTFDFQAVLDRILRNSEIAKSAVAMDASKEIVGDYARNQRKYDAAEAKREAEKELEKLETSLKAQNPGLELKIRVDTPAAGEIQGNNFVIKRPKSE